MNADSNVISELLHDCELVGLEHQRQARRLLLRFSGDSGENTTLTFSGVLALRIVDYRLMNIVSRIVIFDSTTKVELVREELLWIKGSSQGELLEDIDNIEDFAARVNSGNLRLFSLDPTWGAELGVIYQDMSSFTSPDSKGS